MVAVVWQFDIRPETAADFERLYGADGDWTKLFDAPAQFERITAAEIQAVAKDILDKRRRTVGVLAA